MLLRRQNFVKYRENVVLTAGGSGWGAPLPLDKKIITHFLLDIHRKDMYGDCGFFARLNGIGLVSCGQCICKRY